ncbi:MAG: TetR/AcrR family transcriptional regulator [Spirochaetes bacterium]|nr:TetR/AcrR family transcriptional regulator [Spirochaetota bacterium]
MIDSVQKVAWQIYPWRDSRERILVGATVAFSRKGFYGTSVREISVEAGLEQPSIYHHFGSKENLYWACLRSTHLYMIRNIRRRIATERSLADEIRSMFRAISWFQRDFPEFFRLLFALVYSSPLEIADRYTSLYAADLFRLVDRAFDRHPPQTARLEKYSLTIHTLFSFILAHTGRVPRGERILYYRSLRLLYAKLC